MPTPRWVLPLVLLAGCHAKTPPAREARATASPASAPASKPAPVARRAPPATRTTPRLLTPLELHRAALVIDSHCDVPLRMLGQAGFDFGVRRRKGHTDLVRMKEGGLDAEFLAVFVYPKSFPGEKAWARTRLIFDAIHRAATRHPRRAGLALTAADVRASAAAGKIALLIGVEGAHALGQPRGQRAALERVRWMYGRGARYMTLTWMTSNLLAGSSGDAGRARGLKPLGRRVVRLMNDLGMMVDVSHASDPTFRDVLKVSRLPVLASHSAARSLADHHRNLTDDMLRALAKNGGAVCVNFFPGFLSNKWMRRWKKVRKLKGAPKPALPLKVLMDHIDHMVQVAGVDHVCLGSDFDGIPVLPRGLDDASKMSVITEALVRRGYKPDQIRKILGLNILRVMEANEKGAVTKP